MKAKWDIMIYPKSVHSARDAKSSKNDQAFLSAAITARILATARSEA